jgi:hypothetical protein
MAKADKETTVFPSPTSNQHAEKTCRRMCAIASIWYPERHSNASEYGLDLAETIADKHFSARRTESSVFSLLGFGSPLSSALEFDEDMPPVLYEKPIRNRPLVRAGELVAQPALL